MHYFVVFLLATSAWAFPQDLPFPKDVSFLDLLTSIMIKTGFLQIQGPPVSIQEMYNCLPKSFQDAIQTVCHGPLVSQPDYAPIMTAECILVNLAKALNNATGVLDVNAFKAGSIDPTSLSQEQKKSAGDSLESCIESEFSIPSPAGQPVDTTKYQEIVKKYPNRSNPTRAMACVAKALLANGCSGVPRNDALTAIASEHHGEAIAL